MGTVVTMATFKIYGTSATVVGLYVEKHVKPICCLIYNVSELRTAGWEIFHGASIRQLNWDWSHNTFRPRKNGGRFADDVFKCILLNENFSILIKFP